MTEVNFNNSREYDFDVVYISYDEPNAEENFLEVKRFFPGAYRVHAVKGFDASHRKAAELASKDYVMIVDGDNFVLSCIEDLENLPLSPEHVLSWSSKNIINGLEYGNGGVKIWPRQLLLGLDCHDSGKASDWYFQLTYKKMNSILSTSVCNASPFQAFRTGFREGVKLCLNEEGSVYPGLIDDINQIPVNNLKRLVTWMSVGTDVTNGIYAQFGARLGFLKALCEPEFDVNIISDYDWFHEYWNEEMSYARDGHYMDHFIKMGRDVNRICDLPIANLDSAQSRLAKFISFNPPRIGTNRDHEEL